MRIICTLCALHCQCTKLEEHHIISHGPLQQCSPLLRQPDRHPRRRPHNLRRPLHEDRGRQPMPAQPPVAHHHIRRRAAGLVPVWHLWRLLPPQLLPMDLPLLHVHDDRWDHRGRSFRIFGDERESAGCGGRASAWERVELASEMGYKRLGSHGGMHEGDTYVQ